MDCPLYVKCQQIFNFNNICLPKLYKYNPLIVCVTRVSDYMMYVSK
jgi:hypothetical protein